MAIKKRRSIPEIIDQYFDSFEKWAERFQEELTEKPSWNLKACTIEPLRNMHVTPTEVIISADLPFTEKAAVKVKPLDDNVLEITAKMRRKIKSEELGITHRRGEFHSLHCQIRIPTPVDSSKMKTTFNKGMLEIRLPRRHGREIQVE